MITPITICSGESTHRGHDDGPPLSRSGHARHDHEGHEDGAQVDRQRAALDHAGDLVGPVEQAPEPPLVGAEGARDARHPGLPALDGTPGPEQHHAAADDQRRQPEGGGEPVPEGEVLDLPAEPEDLPGPLDERCRPAPGPAPKSSDSPARTTGAAREQHARVRGLGAVLLPREPGGGVGRPERPPHEAGAVGEGEHRADHHREQQHRLGRGPRGQQPGRGRTPWR